MDVRLFLLMNGTIVINCQPTISNRNDATDESEFSAAIKSQVESIQLMLGNLKQEMKSEFEDIRQIVTERQNVSRNGLC